MLRAGTFSFSRPQEAIVISDSDTEEEVPNPSQSPNLLDFEEVLYNAINSEIRILQAEICLIYCKDNLKNNILTNLDVKIGVFKKLIKST